MISRDTQLIEGNSHPHNVLAGLTEEVTNIGQRNRIRSSGFPSHHQKVVYRIAATSCPEVFSNADQGTIAGRGTIGVEGGDGCYRNVIVTASLDQWEEGRGGRGGLNALEPNHIHPFSFYLNTGGATQVIIVNQNVVVTCIEGLGQVNGIGISGSRRVYINHIINGRHVVGNGTDFVPDVYQAV